MLSIQYDGEGTIHFRRNSESNAAANLQRCLSIGCGRTCIAQPGCIITGHNTQVSVHVHQGDGFCLVCLQPSTQHKRKKSRQVPTKAIISSKKGKRKVVSKPHCQNCLNLCMCLMMRHQKERLLDTTEPEMQLLVASTGRSIWLHTPQCDRQQQFGQKH
jgi:hypothetical protein